MRARHWAKITGALALYLLFFPWVEVRGEEPVRPQKSRVVELYENWKKAGDKETSDSMLAMLSWSNPEDVLTAIQKDAGSKDPTTVANALIVASAASVPGLAKTALSWRNDKTAGRFALTYLDHVAYAEPGAGVALVEYWLSLPDEQKMPLAWHGLETAAIDRLLAVSKDKKFKEVQRNLALATAKRLLGASGMPSADFEKQSGALKKTYDVAYKAWQQNQKKAPKYEIAYRSGVYNSGSIDDAEYGKPEQHKISDLSRDGTRVISDVHFVEADRVFRVWEPATGKLLFNIEKFGRAEGEAEFSPDGSAIAARGYGGGYIYVCYLFDVATGKQVGDKIPYGEREWEFIGWKSGSEVAFFNPKTTSLEFISAKDGTGKPLALKNWPAATKAIAFCANSAGTRGYALLDSGSVASGFSVVELDLASGENLRRIELTGVSTSNRRSLGLSADEKQLVFDRNCAFVDLATGLVSWQFRSFGPLVSVSKDHSVFGVADYQQIIELCDLPYGRPFATIRPDFIELTPKMWTGSASFGVEDVHISAGGELVVALIRTAAPKGMPDTLAELQFKRYVVFRRQSQ